MKTELILIRHGETEWNRDGRIQGHLDSALTAEGIAQASACARRLRSESIDQVVASDLQRVRHTAALLLEGRALPIVFDAELRERSYGIGEGLTYSQLDALHAEYVSSIRVTDPDFAVEGSESRRQFHSRVTSAIRRIATEHAGKRVLVVTHGGVLGAIYRWLKMMPISSPFKVPIPNVAYNRVTVEGDPWTIEAWTIDAWGDIAHFDVEAFDEL